MQTNPTTAYNYQYDRFGNRWQQNLTAGSGYTSLWNFSDSNNQISSYATYDAAGNIISDDANAYTYDAENRIISLTNSSGTYTYNYDALGQRVQKTVGGVGLNYLYDLAGREVTRVDTQAGWVSGEVYAGAQHLATYGDSTTTFDHSDWLGTERYRTTAAGGFAESCQSLVFGDGFSCTGSDASVLHFMGKEHDAESDLENFGARYYNSRYARFVTPDWSDDPEPIPYADLTNPQTLNQYVIVHDNPNTFADLDGHEDDDGGADDTGGSADYFAILLGLGDPIPVPTQQPPPPPPLTPDSNLQINCTNADCTQATQTVTVNATPDALPQASFGGLMSLGAPIESRGQQGGQGKGERRQTGKPDNPGKHARPIRGKPGRWEVKDPHTGKWIEKPPGWSPDTAQRVGLEAAAAAAAAAIMNGIVETAPEWLPFAVL